MVAVRLGQLRHPTGSELFDTLRAANEKLHELPNLSDTGRELFRNATLKIYDRPTLRAVMQTISEMDMAVHEGNDLKGDMYEYLLSKLSQSGTNGQFRTPRHIIDLIVSLVDPQPGQRICDPACGTAGFLIAAYNHILRSHTKLADLARGILDGSLLRPKQWEFLENQAFTGFDNDANMVKISILNLYLHQLEKARILHHNPLTLIFHPCNERHRLAIAQVSTARFSTRGSSALLLYNRDQSAVCSGGCGR
jgi:type I restriction enzyme M protein